MRRGDHEVHEGKKKKVKSSRCRRANAAQRGNSSYLRQKEKKSSSMMRVKRKKASFFGTSEKQREVRGFRYSLHSGAESAFFTAPGSQHTSITPTVNKYNNYSNKCNNENNMRIITYQKGEITHNLHHFLLLTQTKFTYSWERTQCLSVTVLPNKTLKGKIKCNNYLILAAAIFLLYNKFHH